MFLFLSRVCVGVWVVGGAGDDGGQTGVMDALVVCTQCEKLLPPGGSREELAGKLAELSPGFSPADMHLLVRDSVVMAEEWEASGDKGSLVDALLLVVDKQRPSALSERVVTDVSVCAPCSLFARRSIQSVS